MVTNPSPIVLDTSVVSLLFRRNEPVTYYRKRIRGHRLIISFQTLEESWFGAIKYGWYTRRKNILRRYLDQFEVRWPNLEMVQISARSA